MITIVDYGAGNLRSIANMLKKIGVSCQISGEARAIEEADKIILPGVGAFDTGMTQLQERGLREVLDRRVLEEGIPVLGVCLGLQLMTRGSEEGDCPGLGWFDAKTVRFDFAAADDRLRVPHMGWSPVSVRKPSVLFEDMHAQPRFYFVHSFHVVANREQDVLTSSDYGISFVSGLECGNIAGVQFHPEKSHKFGMRLYQNFARSFGSPSATPARSSSCKS